MAGIRCLQERRCWRTRGKSAGSCKTPDVVAWKSSSPSPGENDGPCLGTARGMDSAPLWGSQLQGSPLPCHCPTQPPSLPSGPHHLPRAPVPPPPRSQSWHWARRGLAPTKKAAAPCTHPLCPHPGGLTGHGVGMQLRQSGMRCCSGRQGCQEGVCVCVWGGCCVSP